MVAYGRVGQAEAQPSQAPEWAAGSETRLVEASTAQKPGEMCLALDHDARAERFLLRSLDPVRRSGNVLGEPAPLPHLCEVYRRTDRPTETEDAIARARDIT